PKGIKLRKIKYLNNITNQAHQFTKKLISFMLLLKSFHTEKTIISGIEVMHILKKKKVLQEVKSVQN
ncbi:IS6 family transposase, partial [Priestia megaterium]